MTDRGLSPEHRQMLQLAMVGRPGFIVAAAVVLSRKGLDLDAALARGCVSAAFSIGRGELGDFLRDSRVGDYLDNDVAVIACVEDAADAQALHELVCAKPKGAAQ